MERCHLTSIQAYQDLLDRVFGAGAVIAEGVEDASNFITGAVRHCATNGRYRFFVEQLEQRLHRLNQLFRTDPSRNEVLGKIARLSLERNFAGTLAELAAYDFFGCLTQIEAERTVPRERTVASLVPDRHASSFDGELLDFRRLLFDVKIFGAVLGDVLINIKRRAMPLADVSRIEVDYPYDHPYDSVADRFNEIVAGLRAAASAGFSTYRHPDIQQLLFRLIPDPPPRITFTEHSFRPDRLLNELRYFVLNHFDQVLLDEPNLLVYVVHPWFNFVQTDFSGQAEFYREYCRRVFVELVNDQTPLTTAIPDRAAGVAIPVADIAKRFGAVMFLEDRTVEPPDDFDPRRPIDGLRGRLFVNSNANTANLETPVWRDLLNKATERGVRLEITTF